MVDRNQEFFNSSHKRIGGTQVYQVKKDHYSKTDDYEYENKANRNSKYDNDYGNSSNNNKFFSREADYQYNGFSKSFVPDTRERLVTITKNFYQESENVKNRTPEDIKAFRENAKILVKSDNAPNPITTFEESSFPKYILDVIKKKGFEYPTPIQAQGWPIVLSGRDLIGIAQTGSGKTLGFVLPAIVHIKAQEPLRRGDGPIGLVLAPTRELAMQIYEEFKPFGLPSGLRGTCIYGGADKYPQKKDLRAGCELVIATPGRLIDFLESEDTNLKRVSYLVIDEADKMLDMGFIPQIEKIVEYIRRDRQTLMWSATWPQEIRKLASDLCREQPIRVVVGKDDLVVNKAITQLVKIISDDEKFDCLLRLMKGIYDGSKILIFCQTKKTSDWVSRTLQESGYRSISIHGDKSQKDRDKIMSLFKDDRVPILVATNLAARGLDVKDIRYVINYDFPTQMEEYVHRVGRTGRAGALGTSFTFFTQEDARFAKDLIKILSENNQKVPEEIFQFVNDRRFKDKIQKSLQNAENTETKDFDFYENATPVYRESTYKTSNYNNGSESTDQKGEGGMIRRSNIPSRNVGFFNSHIVTEEKEIRTNNTENLKQIENTQYFPPLAENNTLGGKTSDLGALQTRNKTEPEEKIAVQPNKESIQYGSKQLHPGHNSSKGFQNDASTKEQYKSQNNNNYNNRQKNAPVGSGITRSNFKRLNGTPSAESGSIVREEDKTS